MQVGAYSLHLYCDAAPCDDPRSCYKYVCWEYGEWETRAQAMRAAKRAGWHVGRKEGNDRCPYCTGVLDPVKNPYGP